MGAFRHRLNRPWGLAGFGLRDFMKTPNRRRFPEVQKMGLFVIIALLGAAWLIFTA